MPNFGELEERYFVHAQDLVSPFDALPVTFTGCKITPLIDGDEFFAALKAAIDAVGMDSDTAVNSQDFIYICNWFPALLGGGPSDVGSFSLSGRESMPLIVDLLKEKAEKGVDVRLLGWVAWAAYSNQFVGGRTELIEIRDYNSATTSAVTHLRQYNALSKKCCLNVIAHPAGAAHTKLVIVGKQSKAWGFTGGMDLASDRHGSDVHIAHLDPPHPHDEDRWHDVQVQVEGPAAQALHDFFRNLWNEVISRPMRNFKFGEEWIPSYVVGTPPVPQRVLDQSPVATHHVQSCITIPQFNYQPFTAVLKNPPISFASDGRFEIQTAWRKAILAAETYIYMEDQAFWSGEVFSWINEAVRFNDGLRVILLIGQQDPSDPVFPPHNVIAIRDGLLMDLSNEQIARIRFFRATNYVVHSKTTLIDDRWAIIGSANCLRRSLYTDIEHAVTFMDEEDELVRRYRMDLWGGHFGKHKDDRENLWDIEETLHIWNPGWGVDGGHDFIRPDNLVELVLPPEPHTLTFSESVFYDRFHDPDSRQAWGICP